MAKTLQERVYGMLEQGRSDSFIIDRANINKGSLAAYKAHYTRRQNRDEEDTFTRLEEYMRTQSGIYIPNDKIVNKLRPDQVPNLVDILDTVFNEEVEDTNNDNGNNINGKNSLPKSEIRRIVYDLKNKGYENEEVYNNPRLRGTNDKTIRAFMAHCTMGTYENRELP